MNLGRYYLEGLNSSVSLALLICVALMIVATLLYTVCEKLYPENNSFHHLKLKAYSWWAIVGILFLFTMIRFNFIFIGFFLISLFSFRELMTHFKTPQYLTIISYIFYPLIAIHYYLVWQGLSVLSLTFFPVVSLFVLSLIMIYLGIFQDAFTFFPMLYLFLILTTYFLSHSAILFHLDRLNSVPAGKSGLFVFFVFLTEMNDIFQYYCGKIFRGPPLSPKISPNKTWGGFWGGGFCTCIFAISIKFLTPFQWDTAFFAGFVIFITGSLGDLVISSFKRNLQLKDMGKVIPGHGGLLDRIDSLLFASPAFFYYAYANLYCGERGLDL